MLHNYWPIFVIINPHFVSNSNSCCISNLSAKLIVIIQWHLIRRTVVSIHKCNNCTKKLSWRKPISFLLVPHWRHGRFVHGYSLFLSIPCKLTSKCWTIIISARAVDFTIAIRFHLTRKFSFTWFSIFCVIKLYISMYNAKKLIDKVTFTLLSTDNFTLTITEVLLHTFRE